MLSLKDPYLVNADISHAFRNVPVDPRDAIKCGFQHNNSFYIDKQLVFGAVMGTKNYQRIADAVTHMLQQQNIQVWAYIDDTFAAFDAPVAREIFHTTCELITALGLPLNPDKVPAPQRTLMSWVSQ